MQITLKRGGKVRQNMTYKTKIVIFGKKKKLAGGKVTGQVLLIFYLEVLYTQVSAVL